MKRAFVTKLKDDWILLTEGINVEKMWDMNNLVDIKKLACNNIHVMAKSVIACCQTKSRCVF